MAKGADQNQDTGSRIIKWCKGIKLQNQFEPLASCSEDVRTSASTLNLPGALSPHLSKGGALCKFQSSSIKRLALPHYKAGEIIGTRGENVKWIEAHSGARILVCHTRDVDLIGTPEQIRRAEQLIKDFFVQDTNATFYKSIADDMNHNSAYCDPEKFILVDGFKVKLKYYDLYRAITATYGDLRQPSVLDASEMAVVWIISDILSIVHAMSQVSLLNLTVDFLDDWNKKICLAEHFNYNVAWLRDHFEEIQTEFDRKNRIDAGLTELSSHSKVRQNDLESIEAMIAFLTSRLETAKASSSVKDVLAQTTIKKQEDHTGGDRRSKCLLTSKIILFCFLMFVMFTIFPQ